MQHLHQLHNRQANNRPPQQISSLRADLHNDRENQRHQHKSQKQSSSQHTTHLQMQYYPTIC